MKRIGLNTYCYRMHAFTRHHMPLYGYFWNVTEGDQHYCEYATQEAPARASSISIRNRKEYEFVKVEYRCRNKIIPFKFTPISISQVLISITQNRFFIFSAADLTSTAQPMLIGLKYENDRFHWFDKSTFNYSGFLEPFYKSRFYMLKKGQCRRFFMYNGRREYFVFDINCKIRFFEYRVLCRYQIPAADVIFASITKILIIGKTSLPKPSPQPDDYTQVEQTTQEFLDYYDYWAD
uniref:C-type lectin domain-containing protein n=1 Tax=Elaeophora elaphi TaxID=1147741 RepID=A0A0R3RN64_9BILA